MRRTVMADKGPAPAGLYSHAVVANGFVFVSGQGRVNPETGNMPDAFADQVLPKPIDLSQAPLSTGASLPFLTVAPPLESR